MFETATVRVRAADRRLLSISIVVHTAIVVAVIAASLSSTRLPTDAPRMMIPVVLAAPPPALGTPAPPRAAAARPAARTPVAVPHEVTAPPAQIPQSIPNAAPAASGTSLAPSGESGGAQTEGVPWGTPGGVGTTDAPIAAPDAAGPLVAGTGGVTSPVVIRRVEPQFPQLALRAHMSGWVVLQCVIDRTGHIRDARVVHSSFGAFEQPALDAVQQWLFAPGRYNGQPVDVIFDLTVRFEIR